MNKDNYTSLALSQKLVEHGIVLETEFMWVLGDLGWSLLHNSSMGIWNKSVPAANLSELWRELPSDTDKLLDIISRYMHSKNEKHILDFLIDIAPNPNKLAELLIFVKEANNA